MWLQATTPLVLTLTPAMTARADIASRIGQSPFSADRDAALAGIRTVPYTLKKGETVAQAHGLTVPQLKKLNGLRTFARGFDHLQAGDELDVPAVPLTGGERDNKPPGAPRPVAAYRGNKEAAAPPKARVGSQARRLPATPPGGQGATRRGTAGSS
ncbi:LysM peptidoglycan-binding domain-containing protein, partial [Salmonella enterica]|uniref:LysM peptidoglycan-binding domain-containing protein n=1 Tax=Salmonella enterica TaxID=28901 RepID=UPI001F2299E4